MIVYSLELYFSNILYEISNNGTTIWLVSMTTIVQKLLVD